MRMEYYRNLIEKKKSFPPPYGCDITQSIFLPRYHITMASCQELLSSSFKEQKYPKRNLWLNKAVAYKHILLAGTQSTCSVSLESQSISLYFIQENIGKWLIQLRCSRTFLSVPGLRKKRFYIATIIRRGFT